MANTNLAPLRPLSPIQQQQEHQDQIHAGSVAPNIKPLFVTDIYPRQAHHQVNSSMSLEQYRLQLYNYALNIERLRCPQYATGNGSSSTATLPTWLHPYSSHCATSGGNNRLATLSTISLFPQSQRIFQPEEPKPQHSYIGLIAMAILSSSEMKLVLSDIYQYILDNYPYFRTRGPGWRNSIRHNLSLNDCFIKSGRSANGKGHYWAIHPANMDDFRKGDFRRRKAQRKVRKHMGLSVDDASTDSPSPPPLDLTTPPPPNPGAAAAAAAATAIQQLVPLNYPYHQHYFGQFFGRNLPQYAALQRDPSSYQHHHHQAQHHPHNQHQHISYINSTTTTTIANLYSQTRKRQFDVASLLAPDVQIVDIVEDDEGSATQTQHTVITKVQVKKHQQMIQVVEQRNNPTNTNLLDIDPDADIDVDGDGDDGDEDGDGDGDGDDNERNADRVPEQDNNSYLSDDARRSSFDADPEDQEPQNFLVAAVSPPSSSSQHDTNSLEAECSLSVAGGSERPEGTERSLISLPKAYVDLNGVDPQLLSRYYGTYMAAAARRASLEVSSRANQSKTMITPPPPPIELLPNM